MTSAHTPVRVLIADDNERVRHGIANMLRGCCFVCGEAADGAKAVEMAGDLLPDLVLLDVYMPRTVCSECARAIHEVSPSTRIVLISVDDSPHVASLVKAVGADGFVSKNCGAATFRQNIDSITTRRR